MYMIFDIDRVNADTTNMRKSLDRTKVVYHENLTNEEDIQTYTHEEILEIMKTHEWSEQQEIEQIEIVEELTEIDLLRDYVLDLDHRLLMMEFGL